MFLRGNRFPSFVIPIICLGLWIYLFVDYLPVLQFDLDFSRQIILANFYLSNIILILTWFFCGTIFFVIFSSFFIMVTLYLMLILGEWGIGMHVATIVFLYIWLRYLTSKIENQRISTAMDYGKNQEELNLAQKTIVEKENLLRALDKKQERLNYLRRFSDRLKGVRTLDDVGRIVTEETSGLFPDADQVLLYILDQEASELALVSMTCQDEKYRSKEKKGTAYDAWVLKRSQPLLIEDLSKDFRFTELKDDTTFQSLCVVPLISKKEVSGILHLSSVNSNIFHTDDLRLLDIVSDLSSVAIQNALLYEKTRALSIIDSLTECYLRRHIEERLDEEIQRSIRNTIPFSVVMADIDYFKHYNDEYGHTAGDHVLRTISTLIKSKVGPSDIVGRYGGEEFILILPQKNMDEAMDLAENIRSSIENYAFEFQNQGEKITISLGVSQYPKDGTSREELVGAADEQLYRAKKRGRNCVCGST